MENCRQKALRGMRHLPAFSPVLNRLIGVLCREDASLSRVAGTIEKDPVLAGNVLRMVNSALYGRLGRVHKAAERGDWPFELSHVE
jgi:HD-like signal output (HDOD) protein